METKWNNFPKNFSNISFERRDWFVCIQIKLSAWKICVISPRPRSSLCRCFFFSLEKWKFLYFSSSQYAGKSFTEDTTGQYRCNSNSTIVAHTSLVSNIAENDLSTALPPEQQKHPDNANRPRKKTQDSKAEDGMFSIVRKLLQDRGISEEITSVIFNSWRKSSQRQYWTYIKRWLQFCDTRKIDSFNPTVNNFLCFLQILFHQSLSYSTINTARSAVSSLLSLSGKENFGSHVLIKRYLKGVLLIDQCCQNTAAHGMCQ